MLNIYVGNNAFKSIHQQGFNQNLFTSFLGASGGPKWFSLFGLDKYLFGEFFSERKDELNLIGSSAGAFRSACFAQNDPVAAISRMAKSYSETVYSKNAQPQEITQKAVELLDYMLGDTGVYEIIDNPIFKAHFLVNKTNGILESEHKLFQLIGLSKSYLLNRIDRKCLKDQYERFVFRPANSKLIIKDPCNFDTSYINLSNINLKSALLASGSIPLVMQGIKDILGAPYGMYRDGGILDYHFDITIKPNDGLTLYPHFNKNPKAGWFDKSLKRLVSPSSYDNVVLLVPSDEFIASLPYSKIPDRNDFKALEPQARIKYWKTVLQETERIAEDFDRFLTTQSLDKIKPLPF
ncbi:patatin-like phospholipase family protein [Shewanella sp. 202IG2-18]|uniref:patatin-like phospholipase family protein n=1 Tax=Parashewanella hymeniacidonis TaxID=2807618 RepID=UPI0019610F72|nr:patatin-like phospholipase family protein [Parashewanella hymeniacidonis]MBM7072483.1 patatin-like phospholipase family protein [Parashewanella hymeniacidonis]